MPASRESSRPTPPPAHIRVCPECAGPMVHASGCVTCAHCGWGRCN